MSHKCSSNCIRKTLLQASDGQGYVTGSMHTNFDMPNVIRFKDMTWAPKCRNGQHEPDHAQLGTVSHHKVSRPLLLYKL